jgi:hypothetical protein
MTRDPDGSVELDWNEARMLLLAAWVLVMLALVPSCSSTQWGRFRAHSSGVAVGVVAGGAAVATGGTAGLLLAVGGLCGGVAVDQALGPEPEVVTRTVTTVVQVPPPAADGTPAKPAVATFVDNHPGEVPQGLDFAGKLPGSPLSWIDRMWKAIQVLGIVLVGIVAVLYLLLHPKVLLAIFRGAFTIGSATWARASLAIRTVRKSRIRPDAEGKKRD